MSSVSTDVSMAPSRALLALGVCAVAFSRFSCSLRSASMVAIRLSVLATAAADSDWIGVGVVSLLLLDVVANAAAAAAAAVADDDEDEAVFDDKDDDDDWR